MQTTLEAMGDVAVIVLQGDYLDASNTKAFKANIATALGAQTKVVLDMGKVTFLDSSGCGGILSCLRQLNTAGGDLKLCNVTKPVRAMLELVKMHRILEIFNTREEAVKAFNV